MWRSCHVTCSILLAAVVRIVLLFYVCRDGSTIALHVQNGSSPMLVPGLLPHAAAVHIFLSISRICSPFNRIIASLMYIFSCLMCIFSSFMCIMGLLGPRAFYAALSLPFHTHSCPPSPSPSPSPSRVCVCVHVCVRALFCLCILHPFFSTCRCLIN